MSATIAAGDTLRAPRGDQTPQHDEGSAVESYSATKPSPSRDPSRARLVGRAHPGGMDTRFQAQKAARSGVVKAGLCKNSHASVEVGVGP